MATSGANPHWVIGIVLILAAIPSFLGLMFCACKATIKREERERNDRSSS